MARFSATDLDIVKRAHAKTDWTEQRLQELLMCQDEPLYFIENFVRLQHPTRGALPFKPYEFQKRMVVAMQQHRFTIIMAARQCGKTSCTSAYLTWRALFIPDSTILVVANKFSQALEVMERVRYCYENLPNHIRAGVTEYNKSNISFDNGSRIIARATSSDAGRGLAVSLLYVDELCYIQPNKQKEFWTSIQPTLAEGGSCIITSTPKNDEDIFAQLWKGAIDNVDEYGNENDQAVGKNGFFAVKVPWWEHPDRDEEWARPFRESLGEARFRQEFELDFVSDDETLINPLCLSRIIGVTPSSYTGTVRWYHDPEPNHAFLVALDPAMGTEGNYGAIEAFQLPEMIQVAEWQHNGLAARHQVRVMMEILCEIEAMLLENPEQIADPEIYWSFENNTLGEGVLTIVEDTSEDRFPGMLVTERRRKGIQMRRVRRGLFTTNRSKLSACARLKSLIESDRMLISSKQLIRELKNFVATGSTFQAKPGEFDDLVSATLIAVRMLDIVLAWGSEAGDLRERIEDDELSGEPMPVII
jgi:Terminase large subunit, T4likevirus-type, N-terminal/Terminase RNaseH-like domain